MSDKSREYIRQELNPYKRKTTLMMEGKTYNATVCENPPAEVWDSGFDSGFDTANERIKHLTEVMHWAQAVLTALNVGDVQKDSGLHLKLREVMIAYREAIAADDKARGNK